MEFTEKDRKFLVKLAKKIDDVDDAVGLIDERLLKVEGKVPSHIQQPMKPDIKVRSQLQLAKATSLPSNSSIDVIFKDRNANDSKRRILVESIYKTLKELCEKNNIFTLDIKISNTK